MVAQVAAPEFTYEEFMHLQEEARAQGVILGYELDRGELVPVSPLGPLQGRLGLHFGHQLVAHVLQNGLGEVFADSLMDLGGGRWFFPDYAFLTPQDVARFDGRRLPVPPTLIGEVAVPSSLERDTVHKKQVYHEAGVPWYWIVDLVAEQIEEYRHTPGGYESISRVPLFEPFHPALFPGLTIHLRPLLPPGAAPPAAG